MDRQRPKTPGRVHLVPCGDLTVAVEHRTGHRSHTVVLLHGGGQTRHSWSRTASRLASAGWGSLAPDARGHGDSEWATDGDYSLPAMLSDLRQVLSAFDSPGYVLVGASMGGMTALLATPQLPDLVHAVVLVDVVPRIEQAGAQRVRTFMSAHTHGFASLEEVSAAVAAYNPQRVRPATRAGLRKNLREGADGRWYWHWDPAFLSQRTALQLDKHLEGLRAAAGRVNVPALLVRGAQSDVVSPQGAAELLQLIPHASYVDVADTGHMVAGDDNDVFTDALLQFLNDQVETGRLGTCPSWT